MTRLVPVFVVVFSSLLGCSNSQVTKSGGEATNAGGDKPAATPTGKPFAGDFDASTVVLTLNDERLTLAKLDALVADELGQVRLEHRRQVQEIRRRALQRYLDDKLLDAEVKRLGLADKGALFQKLVDEKTPEPTDEEVKKFYELNKDELRETGFDLVKDRIKQYLHDTAKQERFQTIVTGLRTKAGAKLSLPEIRTLVAATGFAKGPENAPITIVEFSDFECPYCSKAQEAIEKVMSTYKGQVRLVFRDYPLDFHRNARKAAVAARCAGQAGKFWEMHDKLFANQTALTEEHLTEYAKGIVGLDLDKFGQCMRDASTAAKVDADLADGKRVGVSGTPAFFVNGVMLSGAQPFQAFKELIDRELARLAAK